MVLDDLSRAFRIRVYRKRIARTLKSGVKPLSLKYSQLNACDTRLPIAYRTETVVRSMALGYLTASEYKNACETSDVGFRMAEWGVIEAMQHITRFIESGRNIEWISVKCPAKMVERVDFYKWMKRLIKENNFQYQKKLCLEFDASIFEQNTDDARLAVLDMKLLGVKTMVMADENTSVSKLVDVPVDIVLLAPSLTRWTGSRNKPQLIPTMVSYLKSMRAEVYADGVLNKDQILLLSRSECGGYATDPSYKGENATIHFAGVRKAFEQKDTEEDFEI